MAETFSTLPGVAEKRQVALNRGFDPGEPISKEHYWTDTISEQRFERGRFDITKYWRNFNGTPIDSPEPGGSGELFDVNFIPDIDELLARFTKA